MKRNITKTTSVLIASAMILSMTGCSSALENIEEKSSEDSGKDVIEAVEDYCKAVSTADADSIIELSADDLGDSEDNFREALDFDNGVYSDDMAGILSAITDTIEYEIDEDSLDIDEDKGTASVDVKFTVFDYENNSFDDSITCLDDAVDAIKDGDTEDIELSLELEKTDDGWRIENTEDNTETIYEFMIIGALDPSFSFDAPATTAETNIWGEEPTTDFEFYGPSYINCRDIDYDNYIAYADANQNMCGINMSPSVREEGYYADLTGYYGTAELNGEIVMTIEDDESQFSFYADDTGMIQTGEYTLTYYDPAGAVVYQITLIVE